jgi:hypothetical protein
VYDADRRGLAAAALIYATVFALTSALRFLALAGFTNDQFIHLAGAQQMLFGDWPTRDFVDPGHPLMFAVSAGAQLLLGRGLFAEAVLNAVAFGFAAACTVAAARELTGSWWLGLTAAALEVVIVPRGYSYPKILLYAAAPLVMWWYLRRRTWGRTFAMAIFIAIAFLFRHDHGAYLGVGAVLTVALGEAFIPGAQRARRVSGRVAVFGAFVVAALLPYLLYLEIAFGLFRYFMRGLRFMFISEPPSSVWPALDVHSTFASAAPVIVFYLYYLVPLAAAVALFRMRHVSNWPSIAARVAPLIVVALLVNKGFIRNFPAHVPDAIVLPALLGVWLLGLAARGAARSRLGMLVAATAAIVAVVGTVSVGAAGDFAEQLDRAGLFGGLTRMPGRFSERAAELRGRYTERQMPTGPVAALVPFLQYVDRCTGPEYRLLVPGYAPEVPFYARRPFAGGDSMFLPSFHALPEDDAFVANRLARETVAFVVWGSRWDDALDRLPSAAAYVKTRFVPLVSYPLNEGRSVRVLVNRTLPVVRRDEATGWPCFR